ncbi:hypothetical protein CEXT_244891 [Caerostris extrusa]|uniref:Uncharacterized protein n=1 Tax=Caerostris extrusa TaxID=172846 RepID=A0AAV4P143_CAEEX|nr:hypothetical protein CEXT_244891 [Caerostris extrusa]
MKTLQKYQIQTGKTYSGGYVTDNDTVHITNSFSKYTLNQVGKRTCVLQKAINIDANDRATKQFTFYNNEKRKNDNFSRSMNCEANTNESIPLRVFRRRSGRLITGCILSLYQLLCFSLFLDVTDRIVSRVILKMEAESSRSTNGMEDCYDRSSNPYVFVTGQFPG